MKVVVIEDVADIARLYEMTLQALLPGSEVVTLPLGAGAAEAVAVHAPEAVVLDLHLPDISGEDVYDAIRESSDVPVLVVSGDETRCQRLVRTREPAPSFLIKPFSPNALVAKVQAMAEAGPLRETC